MSDAGILAKGEGRKGRNGRGKRIAWGPWTGQLGKEKAPQGEPYGARKERDS